jgi:hypothetical protein
LRTLFFRIFISFWLAMAMILAGAIAVTATLAWYRMASLDSINPGELINDASVALKNQGIAGLKTWLETVTSAHPDLDIYVVDAAGQDVLRRPLPERIEQVARLDGGPRQDKDGSFGASYWPYGYDWSPHGLTQSHSSDFNRSHLLANPKILGDDGASYTLLVAWFGATPMDEIGADGHGACLGGVGRSRRRSAFRLRLAGAWPRARDSCPHFAGRKRRGISARRPACRERRSGGP